MALGDSSIGLLFKLKADTKDAAGDVRSFRSLVAQESQSILRALPGGNALSQFAQGASRDLGAVQGALGSTASSGAALGPALANPIGIALAAIGALAVGVISLGVTLFDMARRASEAGSVVYDMTQKTGLGAETVTALGYAFKESGSSAEAMTTMVNRFRLVIIDAGNGVETARQKLIRLGLDPQKDLADLDGALGKVFKRIQDAPNDWDKLSLAADAFGKKTAGEILPVIDSFDGDLEGLIKRAKELGVTLTDEQVKAADAFGDALDTLGMQATNIGNQFALAFAPAITEAMQSASNWIAQNKDVVIQWGTTVGNVMRGVRAIIDSEIGAAIIRLAKLSLTISGIYPLLAALAALGASQPKTDVPDAPTPPPGGPPSGTGGKGGGADKAQEEARKELEREAAEFERIHKKATEDAKREYDTQYVNLKRFTDAVIAQENDFFNKRRDNLLRQADLAKTDADRQKIMDQIAQAQDARDAAIQRAKDDRAKKEEDAARAHIEALLKLQEEYSARAGAAIQARIETGKILESEGLAALFKLEQDAYQGRLDTLRDQREALFEAVKQEGVLEKEVNQEALSRLDDSIKALEEAEKTRALERERKIAAAQARELEQTRRTSQTLFDAWKEYEARERDRELADLDARADRIITRTEILKRQTELELEAADERSRIAQEDLARRQEEVVKEAQTDQEKLLAKQRFNDLMEAEEKRHQDERDRIMERANRESDANDPTSGVSLFGPEYQDALDEGADKWTAFGETVMSVLEQGSAQAGNFGTIISSVFNQLAGAVGNVVKNFVLFGTAGTSFRKFAAEVIASVAQMAAVKAVWELAEGLAASALFWWTGDPRYAASASEHYAAAALYGGIAVVAAAAGRIVAGNSFAKDQAGGGAGSGGGGGTGGGSGAGSRQTTNNEPTTINMGRQVIEHVFILRLDKGLVGEQMAESVRNNGQVRTVIQNELGVPTGEM